MVAYFTKELSHNAIVGPCTNLPFKVYHSPMLSTPKDNDTRRVIVNLSHPYGNSINVLLSKIDISRVFRNLRLDPCEYNLMGLSWDNRMYMDMSLPMGAKTGSALFQRVTDVLRHIMASEGVTVFNYIDDVLCVHT